MSESVAHHQAIHTYTSSSNKPKSIFLNQEGHVRKILTKFSMEQSKPVETPCVKQDAEGKLQSFISNRDEDSQSDEHEQDCQDKAEDDGGVSTQIIKSEQAEC